MTAEVPAGPIGEAASKEPSETMLVVQFLMPSTRLLHISSGSMNLSSKIVGSLIALLNPSDRVDQVDSSSKSDRAFTGGSKMNSVAGPSILKLLEAVLTKIGRV